jgi:translation elongation factor EF-Tu-like GTPase
MENEFYTVKATFRLVKTEDGGRKTGIFSGYRPNHVFEYKDDKQMLQGYMGEVQFDDERILPGQEKVVMVKFIRYEPMQKYLKVGAQWWIHEGPRMVGEAQIIEILP